MIKKAKQQKSSLPTLLVPLLLVFAGVIYFLLLTRQQVSINQLSYETGSVDLNLIPADSSVELGKSKTLELIATTTSELTAANIEINYDSLCGTPSVTQGSFLTHVATASAIANGKINFAYSTASESAGVSGTGVIASINVTPTASGRCELVFTESTTALVVGSDNNQLHSASSAVILTLTPTSSSQASPSPFPASPTPSKTTSLRSTATCNSLSFAWDKISGAKGYIIDLADNNNFDNKKSSGTLGSDRDNYNFTDLKNGTRYYARVSQTDIPDFPRYTQLNISTLGSCSSTPVTTTAPKPSVQDTKKPATVSPSPKPAVIASAAPRASLEPANYTDNRFENAAIEDQSNDDSAPQSLFARFIAWLASLFE